MNGKTNIYIQTSDNILSAIIYLVKLLSNLRCVEL